MTWTNTRSISGSKLRANLNTVRFGAFCTGNLASGSLEIGAGMSPKAFDDYKVSMGKDFEKALEAIKTQDARSDEAHLKKYAELVWLFNLHKDDIDWSRYPCLFKNSPCFLCPHRSCGKPAPDVVLELLEREHCRQIHLKEGQATDRHCPLHQG